MIRALRQPFAESGFTLVEVLVTVVIFSVGLLGLAGLQATGIKMNHSSLLRSQATLLAYDIVDSMRANRTNFAAYAITKAANPYESPADLAQSDINLWLGNLAQALPGGDGAVTLNGNRASVQLWWDESRSGTVATAPRLTLIAEI